MAGVTLRRLTRRFEGSERAALSNLDLDVDDGELLVVVGPSGCGKSTALRLIAGLDTPDAGEIRIGDRDVAKVAPDNPDKRCAEAQHTRDIADGLHASSVIAAAVDVLAGIDENRHVVACVQRRREDRARAAEHRHHPEVVGICHRDADGVVRAVAQRLAPVDRAASDKAQLSGWRRIEIDKLLSEGARQLDVARKSCDGEAGHRDIGRLCAPYIAVAEGEMREQRVRDADAATIRQL